MTRINNVCVKELSDQHLFTEYRELPRILSNVRKAVNNEKTPSDFKIPTKFTLGKGHMTFFYDKLQYLKDRHDLLIAECLRRGINISRTDGLDISEFDVCWRGNNEPTIEDIGVLRSRLSEKFDKNPTFYKYEGEPMSNPYK